MIPVRGFEGKTVAVFGLARTGLTAARALIGRRGQGGAVGRQAGQRARPAVAEGLTARRPDHRRLERSSPP